jgi:hypothetical protein
MWLRHIQKICMFNLNPNIYTRFVNILIQMNTQNIIFCDRANGFLTTTILEIIHHVSEPDGD